MQCRIQTKRFAMAITLALIAAITAPVPLLAQSSATSIRFSSFTVPGSSGGNLGVNDVNNKGEIVGSYTISSGTFGFLRSPNGSIASVADPLNTSPPTYTQPVGVNNKGTITGVFFNNADNAYEGFQDTNGTYTTYVFPGLPPGSETALYHANDFGGLCGFIFQNTPPFQDQGFVSLRNGAKPVIFSVANSINTFCVDINDFDVAAGEYQDSAGVWHGFVRTAGGIITTIDAPGASTVPASVPCPTQDGSGPTAGTQVLGINRSGDVSGHFWDTSNNEHGFVLSHTGTFTQIDFPGAFQTGGGGLNDFGVVVGHYVDASCNASGYIARTR